MIKPGDRVRSWVTRFVDHETMERLIDPTIADMQWEHEQALRSGSAWRGRRALCAGYAALVKVLSVHGVRCGVRTGRNVLIDDERAMRRVLLFALVWTSVLTLAMVLPPYVSMGRRAAGRVGDTIWLLLFLPPQALAIAVPMGFFFGALGGLRARARRKATLQRTIGASVACAMMALVICFWLVPAANQAFRVFVSRQVSGQVTVPKGANEMTPRELHARLESLKGDSEASSEVRQLRWSFHVRSALGIAPIVLGLFACGLSVVGRGRWSPVIGGAVMGTTCLWGGFALGERVPDHMAIAWVPNFLFGAIGLALLRRSNAL